jgi:hypothetical protein
MIVCVSLTFGLVLSGCDNSANPVSATYKVTFDPAGGTITSGQVVQEVGEGKYAVVPAVTPPFSPITANVTFYGKVEG